MAKRVEKKVENEKKEKKKMTSYQKGKMIRNVVAWIMAIVMILGTIISIFGMLIYY